MELDSKVLVNLSGGEMWQGRDKYLREFFEAPFMVFARMVAGEVCGCDIRDCLGVYTYYLCEN